MDIQQVARRARVSTATVSRVLTGSANVRESTSARVRKAIADLNYVPNTSARSLRVGRSRLLGLIVSDIVFAAPFAAWWNATWMASRS
jgi:DNA-binding LacI/PurR family transcriptional regulator